MQNETIKIEMQVDDTGKMKVNVLTDGMPMAHLVLALEKAKDTVMEVFEMACKADGITAHYDRKAKLQKLDFVNAKSF